MTWEGAPIARLTRGDTVPRPRVQVLDSEFLDGAQRERLRVRLQPYVDAQIRLDLAPLFAAEAAAADPALRGPLHRLGETLGFIPGVDEEDPGAGSAAAAAQDRVCGPAGFALFVPAMLKPRAAAMRARLWALAHGLPVPDPAGAALVSMPPNPPIWPPGFAAAMGWIEAGPVLLRLDIAEKVAGELGYRAAWRPTVLPAGLASRFAVRAGDAADHPAPPRLPDVAGAGRWDPRAGASGAGDAGAAAAPPAGDRICRRHAAGQWRPVRGIGGVAALGRRGGSGRPRLAAAGQVVVVRAFHARSAPIAPPWWRRVPSGSTASQPKATCQTAHRRCADHSGAWGSAGDQRQRAGRAARAGIGGSHALRRGHGRVINVLRGAVILGIPPRLCLWPMAAGCIRSVVPG